MIEIYRSKILKKEIGKNVRPRTNRAQGDPRIGFDGAYLVEVTMVEKCHSDLCHITQTQGSSSFLDFIVCGVDDSTCGCILFVAAAAAAQLELLFVSRRMDVWADQSDCVFGKRAPSWAEEIFSG